MFLPDLPRHRVALPADEAVVLAFMRDFYAEEHLSFDQLIAQRALRELLADPRLGIVLLMETRAGTIGYLVLTFGFSLEFHGRFALLDELYLVPAARGHGWGKHALHQAALAAREQRVNSLRLEVNHANAHARSLYLKNGFLDDQREMFTHWL
jgi:GNAT superfamily N-acetyltransferase